MNTSRENDELKSEQAFAALLGSAAPRLKPAKRHENAVRHVVHAEWRHATRRRRRQRWMLISVTAGLAVAVLGSALMMSAREGAMALDAVASIDKRLGDVLVDGNAVSTGSGSYAALAWYNGGSLRLDENTRIEIESGERVYLAAGSLYFDSSPPSLSTRNAAIAASRSLEVRTGDVTISPKGTRYLTTVAGDRIAVRVREGAVVARGRDFESTAVAGQQILLHGSSRPALSASIAFGDAWAWIERTSPPIDTEGRTIGEFLDWVGRETGRALKYDSETAERLARTSVLVGYGRMDLEPSVALRVVMLSTDLDWRIDGGEIVISERPLTGFNRRI